jgi:hypothetical protein
MTGHDPTEWTAKAGIAAMIAAANNAAMSVDHSG